MWVDCFEEAPQEWPRKPISALAAIDPPYELEVGREYPFVEMASVQEEFGGISKFDTRIWDRSGLCRFAENDIILGKITPCAENGKAALVKGLPDTYGIGSTEFFVLSALEDVEPEFLFALVTAGPFHKRLVSRMEGSTGRLRITRDTLKKWLTVPLPEPDEQRRIAAALKLADDAIAKAKAELEATRELKRSLMSELFQKGVQSNDRPMQETKIGLVPADWTVAEIRSFWASSANGLYVPEDQYGSGVPIIRIDTFHGGYFTTRDFKRIRVKHENVEAYSVQAGDLLINRVNSIPFLGKVVFVDEIAEFTVFESNMMRLRFETSEIAQYLAMYMSVPAVKERIWAMGRPAVAQLSINQRDVGKFFVALPGENERKEIIDTIGAAKDAETAASEKLAALEIVKNSLLQNLLTGKIRIPAGKESIKEAVHG